MIKVRITQEYYLRGKERVCDLRVYLPADENGLVIPEFADEKTELLGEKLTPDWGLYSGNDERMIKKRVEAPDWIELEQKVKGMVANIVNKLERIYENFYGELEKAPENREVELFFK